MMFVVGASLRRRACVLPRTLYSLAPVNGVLAGELCELAPDRGLFGQCLCEYASVIGKTEDGGC
jgi:hypothetical protein